MVRLWPWSWFVRRAERRAIEVAREADRLEIEAARRRIARMAQEEREQHGRTARD